MHFRDIFWKPCKVFLHNRKPVCLYFFILICYSCQKSVGSWLSHDIDFNVTEGHKLFKSLGYERSASSDKLLRAISSHDYTFDYFKNLIWSDKHCILEKWNNRAPKFIHLNSSSEAGIVSSTTGHAFSIISCNDYVYLHGSHFRN